MIILRFSTTIILLNRLKLVSSIKKRVQIIAICRDLNKQLGSLAKQAEIKSNAFAFTLSQKTNDQNYERTLSNLQHNLYQLKDNCSSQFERRFIIEAIKVFNTKIKKYC